MMVKHIKASFNVNFSIEEIDKYLIECIGIEPDKITRLDRLMAVEEFVKELVAEGAMNFEYTTIYS